MSPPVRRGRDSGPTAADSAAERLLFRLLPERTAPVWFTAWLMLVLGASVLLGWLAGPWIPVALGAAGWAAARPRSRPRWR